MIDLAEVLLHRRAHGLYLILASDVAGVGQRLSTGVGDDLRHLFAGLGPAPGDHDAGTGFGHTLGYRAPDAPA